MVIQEQLQDVFRDIFNTTTLVITAATSAKDIVAWDSLIHITLIAAIEKEFNIKFSFNEVMQFNTVGDIMEVIDKKRIK
jgi:acyl carrier protein